MRLINADAYAYPGDLVNEPTIDAVEVVRCKECIYFDDEVSEYCNWWERTIDETGYCSYGDRKTALEEVVDLEAQTKANNEAMRKVIDFIVGERKEDSETPHT